MTAPVELDHTLISVLHVSYGCNRDFTRPFTHNLGVNHLKTT